MAGRKWTTEEIELFYLDKSYEEIAAITGRTVDAVRRKRYDMQGSSAQKRQTLQAQKAEDRIRKECRIIAIAKRIGVKLLGK